jgi:Co/Zn/Cd efflux system component
MLSYKNAIMLYLLSSLVIIVGALFKIMHWSVYSNLMLIVGAIGHFASMGIGLFVFFRNRNSSKT